MKYKLLILSIVFVIIACDNPFAPRLITNNSDADLLNNQSTIDGVFQNFRYSYIFKDTLVYGNLLDNNFTFIYRNYDLGIDNSWNRAQDMISTYNLFQAAQSLDLIWNETVQSNGDSLYFAVSKGFNLTIVFNPTDIVRIQGRAYLELKRADTQKEWKIIKWRDESNY